MPRPPLVFIILAFLAAPGALAAQGATAGPFTTVGLSLAGASQVAAGGNLDSWDPGPGIELRALLPFYAGSIELGATQSAFDSRAPGIPSFRARYVFVGWGLGVRPQRAMTLRAVTRLGVYDLQFHDDDLPDYAQSENEVATELAAEAELGIGGRWSVLAAAAGRVVLTEPRIRQLVVSAGIRRTFDTPRWLRDFLD